MWWTEDGDRVLTDAEWAVFNTGLDLLRDFVEDDINAGTDDSGMAGIPAFDHLTSEQKLALLADVAEALRYPAVASPLLTAANEAAVAAVFGTFSMMLTTEIEANRRSEAGTPRTDLRQMLLKAIGHSEDLEEPLPSEHCLDVREWQFLMELLEGRVFWDDDYRMIEEYLDLPPHQASAQLETCGIHPEYFCAVPSDPTKDQLSNVRKRLAKVQGLNVSED